MTAYKAQVLRLEARVRELERELELAQAANTRDMMHFTVKAFAAGERHAGAKAQELERVLPYVQHLPDCPRARDEDAPCACGLWAIPGQPHAGN